MFVDKAIIIMVTLNSINLKYGHAMLVLSLAYLHDDTFLRSSKEFIY